MAYPLRIPMLHTVYYKAPYLGPYSSPDKRSSESSWHCYDVPVCRWYYHAMCWKSVDEVTTTLNKALEELALRCKQNSLVPRPKMCAERSLKETIIHSKYFPNSDWLKAHARKTANYKITKIERALWLAERSVCMRVFKHGCDVNMFCLSRANHARTNLKTFLSLLYLPVP